jgi:hypothetical protein
VKLAPLAKPIRRSDLRLTMAAACAGSPRAAEGGRLPTFDARRRLIDQLFAAGQAEAAAAHRLNVCLHATPCGRICERLVKAPG